MYDRIWEYTVGYQNYTVDGQPMFILSPCRQIYNDMRLDYRQGMHHFKIIEIGCRPIF